MFTLSDLLAQAVSAPAPHSLADIMDLASLALSQRTKASIQRLEKALRDMKKANLGDIRLTFGEVRLRLKEGRKVTWKVKDKNKIVLGNNLTTTQALDLVRIHQPA